jgi:hypothetical protein
VGGALAALLFVFFLVPEFAGLFLYFTLYFRTRDRTVRYRVTLVSSSLIVWFGFSSLHLERFVGQGLLSQLVATAVGAITAVVSFIAYFPPRSIQLRLGVRPYEPVAAGLP